MNKGFYIVGIVLSVFFLFVIGYYVEEVYGARYMYSYNSFDSFSSNNSSAYKRQDLTIEAGLWSLFFVAWFITMLLLGLIKIKTTTTKVLSIIGLSLSGILLLWDFAMISSPRSMSFDEVSPAWGFYSLCLLAFSIVGLIQSIKYKNSLFSGGTNGKLKDSVDLLDS